MYIDPILHVHSTLAEAKEFLNKYGPYYFGDEEARVGISDISQGKRNLIVGEPGVGKTQLLSKLTRWIQSEGGYDLLLTGKVFQTKIQQYEKLVQKTLTSQIENFFLKRGFQIQLYREPQLLDDKRTDLLIRYGFAGPVIIEVKLTSNTDMRMSKPEESRSFLSMKRYMEGYSASHGIFLIIDNEDGANLQAIQNTFAQIPNVWVKVFDYRKDENAAN